MVGRAFVDNSPSVAGLEESAAVRKGSPKTDDIRTLLEATADVLLLPVSLFVSGALVLKRLRESGSVAKESIFGPFARAWKGLVDVCAGPPPKRPSFGTAVEAAVVEMALVNGETFETGEFHAFPCSNVDFDLLAYTVGGPEGGKIDVPK
jgi:hypothetical protein